MRQYLLQKLTLHSVSEQEINHIKTFLKGILALTQRGKTALTNKMAAGLFSDQDSPSLSN